MRLGLLPMIIGISLTSFELFSNDVISSLPPEEVAVDLPVSDPESSPDEFREPHYNTKEIENAVPYVYHPTLVSELEWFAECGPFMVEEHLDCCPRELLFGIRKLAYAQSYDLPPSHSLYKTTLKKILLVGPPGTGKSSIAKTIAYYLRRPYLFITAASICNEYKDSGISNLQRMFGELIDLKIPCVVIFDEITSLTDKFKNDNSNVGVVDVFWTMLDRLEHQSHILFIATANDISKLPATLKDRFGRCLYHIPLPDKNARFRVLRYYLSDSRLADDVLRVIANKTEGLSYRELWSIIELASGHESQLRTYPGDERHCSEDDLNGACESVLRQHKKFKREENWESRKRIVVATSSPCYSDSYCIVKYGITIISCRKAS